MRTLIDTETGLTFSVKDGVNLDKVGGIAYYNAMLCGRLIKKATGIDPVITSGWRDPQQQIEAMEYMKEHTPDLYDKVYAGMIARGQDPATMPHPEGRAIDWRFKGYERAESLLIEVNAWYLEGAKKILGYHTGALILPEKDGNTKVCFHVSIPRQIPDKQVFMSYLTATYGRV